MDEKQIENELKRARKKGSLAKRLRFKLTVPSEIRKVVGEAPKEGASWSVLDSLSFLRVNFDNRNFTPFARKRLREVIPNLSRAHHDKTLLVHYLQRI